MNCLARGFRDEILGELQQDGDLREDVTKLSLFRPAKYGDEKEMLDSIRPCCFLEGTSRINTRVAGRIRKAEREEKSRGVMF